MKRGLLVSCAVLLVGCTSEQVGNSPAVVGKQTSDVVVAGSAKADPRAVAKATDIVAAMLRGAPALREAFVRDRVRVVVIGVGEVTTDLPERSGARPRAYHDIHRRASHATPSDALITVGEENLLGFPGDPFAGENLLVKQVGLSALYCLKSDDAAFMKRLGDAYRASLTRRPPGDDSPLPTVDDYWGAGVQTAFRAARDDIPLARVDPALETLVTEIFGDKRADLPAVETETGSGVPIYALSRDLRDWEVRFIRGEETIAPPGSMLLPMLPPTLHVSLRPGYIRNWRSPERPGKPADLYFVNASDLTVRIARIAADGSERDVEMISSGGQCAKATTEGSVWRMSDRADGRVLGYTVTPGMTALRVIRNQEEEDAEFDEDGELDTYIPYPMPLLAPSERRTWTSAEPMRDAVLRVVNDSSAGISLGYFDRLGALTSTTHLRPGDNVTLSTFVNQVWRVSRDDGTVLGYLVSSYKPGVATITDATKPAK